MEEKEIRNRAAFESEKSVEHYSRDELLTPLEEEIVNKYFFGKILDLGCGAGRTTKCLYDKGFDVIGIDTAKNLIKKAKKKFQKIKFEVGDACNLKFKDNSFNIVFFSYNGLDFIYQEKRRIKALKEIERVLKPNGYFAYSSHNPYTLFFKFRPLFLLRNLIRGTLFSKYKTEKEPYGYLSTYYASPKNQKKLIEKHTKLKFIKIVRENFRDGRPLYIFRKWKKK